MRNVPGCFLGTICIALAKGEEEGTRMPASNKDLISFLIKLSCSGDKRRTRVLTGAPLVMMACSTECAIV